MNSSGQVVTWKLTSGVAFDVVRDAITALQRRFQAQKKKVSEFYVDNCCAWRKKLQEVFGFDLKVKLDLFHAIKRVGEKVSKKHPLRKVFMDDWRLVFRDPSDLGKDRKLITPAPEILESNLDKFKEQWKDAEYNKQPVMNESALKEIENIRVHMKKGCLSGIKPGRGTNRNEELHKNLNNIMSASRYGVELAYGLFTECFFRHNVKMASRVEQRLQNSIEFYQLLHAETAITPEKFGLRFKDSPMPSTSVPNILTISSCTFHEAYERINGISIENAKENLQTSIDNDDNQSCNVELTSDEDDLDLSHTELLVSIPDMKGIMMKSLAWYFTSVAVNKVSETAFIDVLHFPFMATSLNSLFDPITMELSTTCDKELQEHEERLDQVLKSWKFSKSSAPKDGNCLLYSIIHNMKYQVNNGNMILGKFLQQCCGIDIKNPFDMIITTLRSLIVAEWLGEYSNEYKEFMTGNQLQEQASDFLHSGEFASNVGDLVIAAISNILKAPIVVFTSVKNMPVVIQHPTHSPTLNMDPIFLAYNQFGSGHYSAAVPAVQTDTIVQESTTPTEETQCSSKKQRSKGCNCGRKSVKGMPCSFDITQYTCRCPCYNEKLACLEVCKCKNCTNPFGIKPKNEPPKVGQKRKREPHQGQSIPLKGKKSLTFMRDMGEPVTTGGFSNMEFLLVSSIIHYLLEEERKNFCSEDIQSLDISKLYQIYCAIFTITKELRLDFALFERTQDEIQKLSRKLSFKSKIVYQRQTQ